MPDLDDNNEDGTDVKDALVPAPPLTPVPVTKKLELTPEELDAKIADAVAERERQNEERIRREEAESQGNYKILFEEAEADKKQANLELWRHRALNKFKLSEDLEDTLVGETEEELMKAAKKLRSSIDKEVENKLRAETPTPPDPGKTNPPRQRTANAEDTIRRNMRAGLGIGRVAGMH
jgi:hypothetical protein